MTIAACYLSPEGVVLGADSTSTVFVAGRGGQSGSEHQYNFAQKVFEFGPPGSTVGVTFWGLGSLRQTSLRTLVAEVAEEAMNTRIGTFEEVIRLVVDGFWARYAPAFEQEMLRVQELLGRGSQRTDDETEELSWWELNLSGGLCVGGRWGKVHSPQAFEFVFGPADSSPPAWRPLSMGMPKFWGCPNLIQRLTIGMDFLLFDRIIRSGKWTGSEDDLFRLIEEGALGQPWDLPLREAVDGIYASIYTTIKAMKFSHLSPVCGGPIEIAVISTDRPFRWVRHKQLGEAIATHETRQGAP